MYKRILIPTDGTEPSKRAILAGVQLAQVLGAQVIGLTVTPEYRTFTLDLDQLALSPEEFTSHCKQRAARLLADISSAAADAGVPCSTQHAVADTPSEAIVEVARAQQCDLINMASHGRHGIGGLLLGSETQKVLVHGNIPVLVHR